jgi:hypothetical protein
LLLPFRYSTSLSHFYHCFRAFVWSFLFYFMMDRQTRYWRCMGTGVRSKKERRKCEWKDGVYSLFISPPFLINNVL